MKRLYLFAAVFVIILGTVIGVSVYKNSPKVELKNAVEEFAEDLTARNEIKPLVDLLEHGMISLDGKIGVDTGLVDYNLYIGGKLYIESDAEEYMISDGYYKYGATRYDFSAYTAPDYSYIDSVSMFGGRYGLVRGDMVSSLGNSELNPAYLSEHALTYEQYNTLNALSEIYDREDDIGFNEFVSEYSAKYSDKLLKLVSEYAAINFVDNTSVLVCDVTKGVSMYNVTLEGEAIVSILDELYYEMSSDESFKSEFIYFVDRIKSITSDHTSTAEEAYDDFVGSLLEYKYQLLSKLEEKSYTLSFNVAVDNNSDKVVRISFSKREGYESKIIFAVEHNGASIADASRLKVTVSDNIYRYDINENSSEKYHSFLSLNGTNLYELCVYKKYHNYYMVFFDQSGTSVIELDGTWNSNSDGGKFTVSSVSTAESTYSVDFTVSVDTSASMPRPLSSGDSIFNIEMDKLDSIKAVFSKDGSDDDSDDDSGEMSDGDGEENNDDSFSSVQLDGEFRLGSYMILYFEGNNITMDAIKSDGYSRGVYQGTYRITGSEVEGYTIQFAFHESDAYLHFERSGEALEIYPSYIVIGGKKFS